MDRTVKPEDDLMRKAERVVRRLTSEFPRDGVPNPALQWHYAVLQQLAVGDELTEESLNCTDMTYPDLEGMMKHIDVLKSFATSVFPDGYAYDTVAGVTPYDPSAKKAKVDLTAIDFPKLYADGRLDTLTLPFLRQFLHDHDASVNGVKKDIVERVKLIMEREAKKS
jgi:hypothetical protein